MHYYYIDFYIKYCNLLSFKLSNWASQQLGVVPPDSCSGNSILLLKILKNLPCISSIRAHLHAVSHSSGTCSGWLKAIPQPPLGLALSSHYHSLSMDFFPLSTVKMVCLISWLTKIQFLGIAYGYFPRPG